ncbi:aminotransferase class IV [Pelomonas sp. CA6]|uniref:aminotransferase class IV n=1 Tax=Pelomonas sp. CA6 TaxID=2907999 RepID=UPI001F4C2A77|nr:aminotransferase class IV [Pelomonas sp. CA6]MCH7343142.1 aminotransferase class IV [Pelomonas sp. CA6]
MNQPSEFPAHAWMDGEILPWNDCRLHVRSQGAFWGANVFEGVRGYWQPASGRMHFFRLDEHLQRLRDSAKCLRMAVPFSDEQLRRGLGALAEANLFTTHVHAVIGLAYGLGPRCESLGHIDAVHAHITALEMPRSPHGRSGIAAGTSSWRRIGDDAMPPRVKTGANYHNSRLAHQEALAAGYQTALILNHRGTLAESPGACVAAVIGGRLVSPPPTSGALPGITLRAVAQIAAELGVAFEQREIDRSELYLASEVMLCGTLVEILPITSIDRIPVGDGEPGPVVRRLQQRFDQMVGVSHD